MLPEDLPFKVVRTNGHDEVLARAANLHIGRAAYETAIRLFPKDTIQYRNGYTVEAVLLTKTETSMRIAVKGADDIMELKQINGAWVTEDCEPVQIQSGLSAKSKGPVVTLDDCICSEELAARLLQLLFDGGEEDEIRSTAGTRGLAACCQPQVS